MRGRKAKGEHMRPANKQASPEQRQTPSSEDPRHGQRSGDPPQAGDKRQVDAPDESEVLLWDEV